MALRAEVFETENEQDFYESLQSFLQDHTVAELWNAIKARTDFVSQEIALTYADVAMCAGDKEAAFKRYGRWLDDYRGDTSFLPFLRSRVASPEFIQPIIPSFIPLISEPDHISKLVGVGALFCLGRWAELASNFDDRELIDGLGWRIAAAVGFAKTGVCDYVNASAFYIPALLQGHGSGKPYNGGNSSIAQAADASAKVAREYSAMRRFAENSQIAKGFEAQEEASPVDLTKIDLFIKTCAKDEEFLLSCLKSIDTFVTGFRQVVIVTDEDHECNISMKYKHVIHKIAVPPAGGSFGLSSGYRMQMVVKLSWMDYTDADAIVLTDSDTIFTRLFTPKQMFDEDKPVWTRGNWNGSILWRPAAELILGVTMPYSYMREHPFILTRDATAGFIEFIKCRFDCSINDLYFDEKVPGKISEFEIFGGYLWNISRHGYKLVEHQWRHVVTQYWSYGGVTNEVKADIERLLQLGPRQPSVI